MANIKNVVGKTAEELKKRRGFVRWSFQPRPQDVRLLTPQEQLERFLRMTPVDLQRLRGVWGSDEVKEYVKKQIRNYRQHGLS